MSRLSAMTTTEKVHVETLGPYAENRRGVSDKVWQLQKKLYAKAKREPKFRFYALYDRIYREDVLWDAWCRVAGNDGTHGVDGVRIRDLMKDEVALRQLLAELRSDLQRKTYRPSAVKRVYIPKHNGKRRPLGIPTVRDRIAQTAAMLVLEPIFEADFMACSHGYRPEHSAHGAIDQIKAAVSQKRSTVLEADLKSYFDTIPHDKLMTGVAQRVSDGAVLGLIRLWLRAPIVEKGRPPRRPNSGTPQGGILSPLLANLHLHWLDRLFHAESGPGRWANAKLIRYADDFVICARYIDARMMDWLKDVLGRLGLTLNSEKTCVTSLSNPDEAVDFLGFTIRLAPSRFGGLFSVVTPSHDAVVRAKRKLRSLTASEFCFKPTRLVVGQVNDFLRGWAGYYRYGYPGRALRKMDWYAQQRLKRHVKRRSQRPYQPPRDVTWYQHLYDQLGLIHVAGGRR